MIEEDCAVIFVFTVDIFNGTHFLHSIDVRNGFIRVQMCFFHTLSTSIPCPCSLFQHMLRKCGENLIWLRLFCMLFFYCHLLFLFSFPSVFPLNTICCMAVFFTRAHKTHFICCFVFGKFGASICYWS